MTTPDPNLDRLSHPLLASARAALDPSTSSREEAARAFLALSAPTRKDEEFRFIKLAATLAAPVSLATSPAEVSAAQLEPYLVPEAKGRQLVFIDGCYSEALSDLSDARATKGLSLHVRTEDRAEVGEVVSHLLDGKDYFVALNTALWRERVDLEVDADTSAGTIHVLNVSTGASNTLSVPRLYARVGLGARVTFVEEYVSLDAEVEHVTAAVVEVDVAESATVNHVKVQDENLSSHHIARTAIRLAEGATYTSVTCTFGAALSRHDLHAQIEGGATMAGLHGLARIDGRQVADTHSVMNHAHPNSESDQLHKCVVGDRAHAVFNGKIFVRQIAQQTNAFQLNRNLLLSERAKVDTKPQLEIFADDVKCTHGATIGQLDEDQLFYLQTRGIEAKRATNLLTYAFAAEVVERVPVLSVRERMIQKISATS